MSLTCSDFCSAAAMKVRTSNISKIIPHYLHYAGSFCGCIIAGLHVFNVIISLFCSLLSLLFPCAYVRMSITSPFIIFYFHYILFSFSLLSIFYFSACLSLPPSPSPYSAPCYPTAAIKHKHNATYTPHRAIIKFKN